MTVPVIRRFLTVPCATATLAATLDLPAGSTPCTGLLVVSGGNEIRAGAWAGQAQLAARLAVQGHAVLRFDRRGVGDSSGDNAGFRNADADIRAALAAFRAQVPSLVRVTAWGNCDAASALMLGAGLGAEALVLSNPWTIEQPEPADDGEPAPESPAPAPLSPAELRAHYRARLASPEAFRRLLRGQVPIGRLIASLLGLFRKPLPPGSLAQDMAKGLAGFEGPVTMLVAERDRTAQAFLAAWDKADRRIAICPAAGHSFVEPHAREWLEARLLGMLVAPPAT